MIDTASGGDGGRLVDLIARLEKTYRRAVDDVNRATDRDIDRAARRKMLLEFGEPTAALRARSAGRTTGAANTKRGGPAGMCAGDRRMTGAPYPPAPRTSGRV